MQDSHDLWQENRWDFPAGPGKPHPLFRGLIEAAQQRAAQVAFEQIPQV